VTSYGPGQPFARSFIQHNELFSFVTGSTFLYKPNECQLLYKDVDPYILQLISLKSSLNVTHTHTLLSTSLANMATRIKQLYACSGLTILFPIDNPWTCRYEFPCHLRPAAFQSFYLHQCSPNFTATGQIQFWKRMTNLQTNTAYRPGTKN
jgi:hypothetical protein